MPLISPNEANILFSVSSCKVTFTSFWFWLKLALTQNNKAIKTAFDSVCGEFHSDTDKKWIVDVDFKDLDDREFFSGENNISNIISTLTDLQLETEKEPMIEILPTKNGVHIITRPFNLKKFRETFFGIDVHKDNPSILYCP
jgi:hypothetical protein